MSAAKSTLDLSLLPDGGVRWLDASGSNSDIVISTRMRLARNVSGYAFTARAREGERLRMLAQVRDALHAACLRFVAVRCCIAWTSSRRTTVSCCTNAIWSARSWRAWTHRMR